MSNDSDIRLNLTMIAEKEREQRDQDAVEARSHKPEWAHWNNLAVVRIDDAIVLSCDIDPAWHGTRKTIIEVSKRKAIVESHIAAGTLESGEPYKRFSDSDYIGDRVIMLSKFRRWGESLQTPFTFPAQFPKAASAQPEIIGRALTATEHVKLRSDREQNLLRVIAGLWALAELPPEHNTAADRISALIAGWGWDKPVKGTIADTILKEAANLPGAHIRNS